MSRMRSRSNALRSEHLVERDLAALGAMQLGIGIDAADARLDLAQFGLA